MIQESEVRDKIESLSQNRLSLESFEDWLADKSWSMHSDSSAEAVDLVSSVHLLLSERDDQIIDNEELRRKLIALANDMPVHYVVIDMDFNFYTHPRSLRITASSSPLEILQPVLVH